MIVGLSLAATLNIGPYDLGDSRVLVLAMIVATVVGGAVGWSLRKRIERSRARARNAYQIEVAKAASRARDRARLEKDGLEERLVRVQDEHAGCRKSIDDLERALRDRTVKLEGLSARLEDASGVASQEARDADRQQARIDELEGQLAELQAQLDGNEAEAARAVLPEATDGFQDDLQEIRGLGPVLEQRLNSVGIRQYRQLACITPENAGWVASQINVLPGRILRDEWAGQARRLHRRKHSKTRGDLEMPGDLKMPGD